MNDLVSLSKYSPYHWNVNHFNVFFITIQKPWYIFDDIFELISFVKSNELQEWRALILSNDNANLLRNVDAYSAKYL